MHLIDNRVLSLVCDDPFEVWRAKTAFTKEPGTIAWLNELKAGDVLYDIGANIGIYTLIAANRVGPTGHVYAFEPHPANMASLARNAPSNSFGNVTIISTPLHSQDGLCPFSWASDRAGSSGSQLGHTRREDGSDFMPVLVESRYAVTLSTLIGSKAIREATRIKIDVDGNERDILIGAYPWLSRTDSVRSLQVEVHPGQFEEIEALCHACGFAYASEHFTANGQKAIDKGAQPHDLAYNAVFEKR